MRRTNACSFANMNREIGFGSAAGRVSTAAKMQCAKDISNLFILTRAARGDFDQCQLRDDSNRAPGNVMSAQTSWHGDFGMDAKKQNDNMLEKKTTKNKARRAKYQQRSSKPGRRSTVA